MHLQKMRHSIRWDLAFAYVTAGRGNSIQSVWSIADRR